MTAKTFAWKKTARPADGLHRRHRRRGRWAVERDPAVQVDAEPARTTCSPTSPIPLTTNTAIIGGGAAQLWIQSTTPDVDLQVTVTEVRPDGKETFVQSGWIRASERKLDQQRSTLLAPVPTFRRADVSPLPKNHFAEVTVPLYYEGHVYRAGSRIRIIVSAPSGDQPIWSFANTVPHERPCERHDRYPGRSTPSRLILPLVRRR